MRHFVHSNSCPFPGAADCLINDCFWFDTVLFTKLIPNSLRSISSFTVLAAMEFHDTPISMLLAWESEAFSVCSFCLLCCSICPSGWNMPWSDFEPGGEKFQSPISLWKLFSVLIFTIGTSFVTGKPAPTSVVFGKEAFGAVDWIGEGCPGCAAKCVDGTGGLL